MATLTIGWEYLTGYSISTDACSRERAEWPPHPARLFMALVAAWGESDQEPMEREALRWLEALANPELHLPPCQSTFERSNITVYVPVNDRAGPAAKVLQSVPNISRKMQPRHFPRVWVGYDPCFIHWSNAEGIEQHCLALDRLCGKVTRVGHSSSLVRMWLAHNEQTLRNSTERWIVDDGQVDALVRRISSGMLDMLIERFNGLARARHMELSQQIDELAARKKHVKGKGAHSRKTEIDDQIEEISNQRRMLNPRPPLRPSVGLWTGYRRVGLANQSERRHTLFDTDLLIMTQVAGRRLPLACTLMVTQALRKTVMKLSAVQSPPAWVTGHFLDGRPLHNEDGHLAYIPLPSVGHQHSEGQILGVGLVFPRSVDCSERGRVLGTLLVEPSGESKSVNLMLGRLGVWSVKKRDWSEQRLTLQPEYWTALRCGAETWTSVTPVVLDRFPKTDRTKHVAAWTNEVIGIISAACTRIGLPRPLMVDIDATSWHPSSPPAIGNRRFRGNADVGGLSDTAMSDGFPPFPRRGTNAPRPQVHVYLRFAEPVIGPLLIGAGRYLGYGLCMPWSET